MKQVFFSVVTVLADFSCLIPFGCFRCTQKNMERVREVSMSFDIVICGIAIYFLVHRVTTKQRDMGKSLL